MTVTAVGLDLDYTLAVPTRDRAALLNEAAEVHDVASLDRDEYIDAHRRHLGRKTRIPVFEELLGDEGDAEVDPVALARTYREAVNDALVPIAGAESLIDELRREYRVGLLTNGPAVAGREKVEKLGWTDRFDAVIVSGEIGIGKPDRRVFEALLDALDARPEETVFVGDEVEADIAGASDAGLHTIQVTFPGGPDQDPRADGYLDRSDLTSALPAIVGRI